MAPRSRRRWATVAFLVVLGLAELAALAWLAAHSVDIYEAAGRAAQPP